MNTTLALQNHENPDCIIIRAIDAITRETYECSNGEVLSRAEWLVWPMVIRGK